MIAGEPKRLIATGCYSGYFPFAPGTAGSALGVIIYWLVPELNFTEWAISLPLLFLLGVYVSGWGETQWGSDPPRVVIDEITGLYVSYAFLPKTMWVIALGFLLFRGFDIIKPPPARRAESLQGGWGIMTDDVVAGIYANLTLRILLALEILK